MSRITENGEPEPWFYYHCKHDHENGFDNYAYQVLGVGMHTETNEKLVVYRALYGEPKIFIRPLSVFMEDVEIDGGTMPRFIPIENRQILKALKKKEKEMYQKGFSFFNFF